MEIDRMVEYVKHYSGEPEIIQFARLLVQGCAPKDKRCEAQKIYNWLLQATRFVNDPVEKEVLATPLRMLKDVQRNGVTSGDCDELATLLAALLGAIGHRPRFAFGKIDATWEHVWVQDSLGEYVDFDLAERLPMGRHAKFTRYGLLQIWD